MSSEENTDSGLVNHLKEIRKQTTLIIRAEADFFDFSSLCPEDTRDTNNTTKFSVQICSLLILYLRSLRGLSAISRFSDGFFVIVRKVGRLCDSLYVKEYVGHYSQSLRNKSGWRRKYFLLLEILRGGSGFFIFCPILLSLSLAAQRASISPSLATKEALEG